MALNTSHHAIFGLLFFFISIISMYRVYLYKDFTGRGKAIAIFYNLIFITSILRALWFFKFSWNDYNYDLPNKLIYIGNEGWKNCLLSEVLMSLGSIGIYLIFILIACYWSQLLRETSSAASLMSINDQDYGLLTCLIRNNLSMMNLFYLSTAILITLTIINLTLFLSSIFNSENMILYDSIVLTVVSILTLIILSALSKRIQDLLIMIGKILLEYYTLVYCKLLIYEL